MSQRTPKVFYTVAAELGGPGIGTTAMHAALGVQRAGLLARLACLKNSSREVDPALAHAIPFLPDGLRRYIPDKAFYLAKNLRFDRAVLAMLKREPGAFDAIHAWNSQASGAVKLAKTMGLRVVIDRASSHIRTQTRILREAYARRGLRYEPTYERVIRRCLADYEIADLVTVPSEFAYRSFVDEGYPANRLVLNPFGIDNPPDRPLARPERRDPFRVLFVGQVGIRKGALDLLEAWDTLKLPNSELVLVGGMEAAAKRLFAPYQGRRDIVFAGFVRDVPSHMARAQVFCFPSLEEGSALVTYEAMSFALPMIVTQESGSVATNGESAVFVAPSSPISVAEAIRRLYEDPLLAERLGRAARARVGGYTWTAYGDRTAETHRRLAHLTGK